MKYSRYLAVLVLLLSFGLASQAQAEDLLRSGTKASSFELGLGPTFIFGGAVGFGIHLNSSYHFSGDSSGFAIGGDMDIIAGGGGAIFIPGVRATYDVEVSNGIYISPFGRFGAAIITNGAVGFDAQFGVSGKVLMNDAFFVSIQPVGIEIFAGSGGVIVAYNLSFGGGMTF